MNPAISSLRPNNLPCAVSKIFHFFSVYRLPAAVIYIERILESATMPKVWKYDVPANLLYFMQNMDMLFTAAYALPGSDIFDDTASQGIESKLPVGVHDSIATGGPGDSWDYFPRSLTARQYARPGKAIRQCCEWMQEPEWKQLLKDITECALSFTTMYELLPDCNILRVRRYLLRLVEACYLISIQSQP